jgi:hypothetical protein
VGVVLHAGGTDRQTDMTKLIVAFRSPANAPGETFAIASFIVKPYICLLPLPIINMAGEGARSLHNLVKS